MKLFSVFDQYKGVSRSIWVIFFARVVTNMGAFIWPMLTLILSTKIGYSATTISFVTLAVGILFIPANIIGGKLADRYDKKKIIILFDTISVLFFMACALIEPGNLMVIFFALAGLFANIEHPSFEAIMMEASKPDEREKVFSLSYLGHNLGFMFGAAIAGLLITDHLSLAFIIDGLTTMTSTILIVFFVKSVRVEDMEDHEKNEYEASQEASANPFTILKERKSVWIQMLVFTLGAFIYTQWSFALPLYAVFLYGNETGSELFGFVSSFNGFIVILLTPVLTTVTARLKEIPKIMIGMSLYASSFLLIKGSPLQIMFFVMIFIFTVGEIINTLGQSPFISRRIPSSHRGRISSIMGIGFMIGGMGGQVMAGLAIDRLGFDITFNALVIAGLLSLVLMTINYRLDKLRFPKLYDKQLEPVEAYRE